MASKLGRNPSQRKALIRDLVTDLIINERITTTHTRAKMLSSVAEKLVTLGKKGDLHARRQANEILRDEMASEDQTVLQKLFSEIGPRYKDRNGGYTRIIKTVNRKGDNAPMSIIEFV